MGANCCVAGRAKPLLDDPQFEVSAYRNVRYSPSWNFRWDNRTHIEDIMDSSARFSHRNSRSISSEIKSGVDLETEGLSSEGSPPGALWKFPTRAKTAGNSKEGTADASIGSNSFHTEKETIRSAGTASASDANPSISLPSTPSSPVFNLDPSSSRCRSFPSNLTSSRQAHRSPGYQLSRQVSDSRIPSLKSLNENSSPEGRQSFVLSISGNDFSTGGSHGGSSDGWSMRTFTELVASSHRERWSFDSENLSSIKGKLARSHSQPLPAQSADLQTCGVCSKLLKERSPWSTQKIVSTNELAVVAILVCGHVYHSECLESVTPETDKFEPPCPICTNGPKLLRKAELKARSKISRTAVADADGEFDSVSECQKQGGKGPRMGASSSMKSSFSRPFLRRHFSIGSRPSSSVSESETTKKKGFWARYRRD